MSTACVPAYVPTGMSTACVPVGAQTGIFPPDSPDIDPQLIETVSIMGNMKIYRCKSCGKGFTTISSMNRHTRDNCQLSGLHPGQTKNYPIINHPIINTKPNTRQSLPDNISIPDVWEDNNCIIISLDHIKAIFNTKPQLIGFAQLSDEDMANEKIGAPYVIILFMELIKQFHLNPMNRNIHLNSSRTDMVNVFSADNRWLSKALEENIHLMMASVSKSLKRIIYDPQALRDLSIGVLNAISISNMHYDYDPAVYIQQIKPAMVAHLTTLIPG